MVKHHEKGKGILLGLHALPRAGKDTLAKELIEHNGFTRFSFAGPLYEEVAQAYGVSVELLESHDWKTRPQMSLALTNCQDPDFVDLLLGNGTDPLEPLTSRTVLQQWGTEYRRRQDPGYWTGQMWWRLCEFFDRDPRGMGNDNRAVITDTRVYLDSEGAVSYDEADLLCEFAWAAGVNHRMVEIVRPGTEASQHSSDLRLQDKFIHLTTANDSTPEQMRLNVVAYLRQEGLEI